MSKKFSLSISEVIDYTGMETRQINEEEIDLVIGGIVVSELNKKYSSGPGIPANEFMETAEKTIQLAKDVIRSISMVNDFKGINHRIITLGYFLIKEVGAFPPAINEVLQGIFQKMSEGDAQSPALDNTPHQHLASQYLFFHINPDGEITMISSAEFQVCIKSTCAKR